jgi:hypothetical protein
MGCNDSTSEHRRDITPHCPSLKGPIAHFTLVAFLFLVGGGISVINAVVVGITTTKALLSDGDASVVVGVTTTKASLADGDASVVVGVTPPKVLLADDDDIASVIVVATSKALLGDGDASVVVGVVGIVKEA